MAATQSNASTGQAPRPGVNRKSPYDRWAESTGVPIHKGYYVEDARTVELGPWEERECNAAILTLAGQEGFTEARVSEIPPGATLPPQKFSFDEAVYVLDGRGITTVSAPDGSKKRTFEWQPHSMFVLPRYAQHQFSNTQGHNPARLLHFNFLPLAMAANPDPDFHFNNPYSDPKTLGDENLYSAAKAIRGEGQAPDRALWIGNFFADMRQWDQLDPYRGRGAGGHVVNVQFPGSELWSHMSVFPAQTYKKAHRHGPGVVIVIPAGEGFSVMWQEGQDKVFIPWHEGSVFVPPDRWFHQHFNVGGEPGRYLALHSPRHFNMLAESVRDPARDQIEYPDEDPWIRETFASELAKRGLKSIMPDACYQDRTFEWDYGDA